MTRDDIIRMAVEAGLYDSRTAMSIEPFLKRFAALVAAHEREACARVLEDFLDSTTSTFAFKWADACGCAKAIRARRE